VKNLLLLVLVIGLAISACTAKNETSSPSLIGSWKLTSYSHADVLTPAVSGTDAGLTFNDDGTLTGNSGCNGLGGNYKAEGDQVTFSDVVSTLMACDEARMAQEGAFHQVLTDTATFNIEGNTLTITNNDYVLVLVR
jgi:heat shock protein HslJ